jgi:hypothetical protein
MSTDRNIAALKAQIEKLDTEGTKDQKATEKALAETVAQKVRKTTPIYSELKVSWVQDFEPIELKFAGELTEQELRKSFQGLPIACAAELNRQKPQPTGSTRITLQAAFRRRHEAREAKAATLREQLRRLRAGAA